MFEAAPNYLKLISCHCHSQNVFARMFPAGRNFPPARKHSGGMARMLWPEYLPAQHSGPPGMWQLNIFPQNIFCRNVSSWNMSGRPEFRPPRVVPAGSCFRPRNPGPPGRGWYPREVTGLVPAPKAGTRPETEPGRSCRPAR